MLMPEHCKHVGVWRKAPEKGEAIYFLTQYVIDLEGEAIFEVQASGKDLIRRVESVKLLADDVAFYDDVVELFDRAGLVEKAADVGATVVVFRGRDGHMSFVKDPDPSAILSIEVFDVVPPHPPRLADTIHRIEASGVFGDLLIRFESRTLDLSQYEGKDTVFPCEASGLHGRFLDGPLPQIDNPLLVGCDISRGIYEESYGDLYRHINICPLGGAYEPSRPFIVRCCVKERSGFHVLHDKVGVAVHWGATPHEVAEAVRDLARRIHGEDRDI